MKQLLKYLKKYKKESIVAPLFKCMEACLELFVPLIMAKIIDVGIANQDVHYIIRMCLLLVGLGLTGLLCSVTAQYFAAKAAVGFATRVRHELFSHIQGLSYTEIDTMGTSALITRMTSDINQTQSGVNMVLRLFLRSPFIVFGAMIMAFTIDVRGAVIFAVVIPLLSIVVFGLMAITIPLYKKVQNRLDTILSLTRDNLSGVRVIRAFHKESSEKEEFAKGNTNLRKNQLFSGKISALMNPVTYVMINIALVLLIQRGAVEVNTGALLQGQVVALINYMSQILVELIKMANLIIIITKAIASGNRIAEAFSVTNTMRDEGVETIPENETDALLAFKNAGFAYAGTKEETLSNISFEVKAGETIGIIGGTGSGKTTLVNLIPRFYDVTAGTIEYRGKALSKYPVRNLRQRIGIVPQRAVLFEGTIRENLLWGNEEATEQDILDALEISQSMEVLKAMPDGVNTKIIQEGKNLSGGQRQRLTIARALVRKPEILILDDSASALDYATDAKLRKALREISCHPTVFIVSQRTSSIWHADKIVVLEDGCIAGIGNHDALLENCDVYREIYDSQFKKGINSQEAG